MIDHPYISSNHLARVTNIVWLANVTLTIACNNFFIVLAYICILPDSRFLSAKKIPGVGLNKSVNLATKMVLGGDEGQ